MREAVWPLVSASEMRALDAHTIEALGVPGEILMESAGHALASQVLALAGAGARVVVACGRGNNGGDGLVAARHLAALGVDVSIWPVGGWHRAPDDASPDARANWRRARALDVDIVETPPRAGPGQVWVDAMFGTGLTRSLEGAYADAVDQLAAARELGARVVAVDTPSGLDADTGQPLGRMVAADLTVTIGLPKLGLALEPGRSHAGRVVVARIGIVDSLPGASLGAALWTPGARGQSTSGAAAQRPQGHLRPRPGRGGQRGQDGCRETRGLRGAPERGGAGDRRLSGERAPGSREPVCRSHDRATSGRRGSRPRAGRSQGRAGAGRVPQCDVVRSRTRSWPRNGARGPRHRAGPLGAARARCGWRCRLPR